MERKITYYESVKEDNTLQTFKNVEDRLKDSGIKKIVIASTIGKTAQRAMEFFKDKGIQLVVIPHQFDFARKGSSFPKELVKELRNAGHEVHFGTMLFHTDKLYANSTPTIIANFLRCFSEGVKVCYEIVLMAADGGMVDSGEKVIAIAGTGLGSDTAMVMQASSTQNLSKRRVNEIICKPINELKVD